MNGSQRKAREGGRGSGQQEVLEEAAQDENPFVMFRFVHDVFEQT